MLLDACVSVCMLQQMITLALYDPKTYIWIDLLYNSNANEWIALIRTNMETKIAYYKLKYISHSVV